MSKNENIYKGVTHKLQLTTLTPVAIGDGGLLSPLTDFIISENRLYYIDHNKFEKLFEQKPNLIDKFTKGVLNISKKRKNNFLIDFIKKNLGIHFKEVCYQYEVPAFGFTTDNVTQMQTIIKNADAPYISGSTIKGAIKGAILYDWLINSQEGSKYIKSINEKSNEVFKRNKALLEEYIELEVEKQKLRKERRRLSYEDNNRLRSLSRTLNDAKRPIERIMDRAINELFKPDLKKAADFYFLRVSDTTCYNMQQVAIHNTKRLHLTKGDFEIPATKEAIQSKENKNFTIQLIPRFQHPFLQYLNKEDGLEQLIQRLNDFAYDCLELDSELVDDNSDTLYGMHRANYNHLMDFMEQTLDEIDALSDNTTAYLRIGSGKNYFHNSIGLALYKQNKDSFNKMAQLFRLGKGKSTQKLFPITRVLSTHKFTPLGWVKISLK